MKVTAFLALLILLPPARAIEKRSAADGREAFRVYTRDVWEVDEGLPQDSVQTIVQTNDGYVWLGTETGLVRFNGIEFKVFRSGNTPGLGDDYIESLLADPDGSLWIGTRRAGVSRFKNGVFRNVLTVKQVSDAPVKAMARDTAGRVFIGTGAGVKELRDGALIPVKDPDPGAPKPVTALLADREGNLWVGTAGVGLNCLRSNGWASYGTAQGISSKQILALYQDSVGRVWIGTEDHGLYRFSSGLISPFGRNVGLSNMSIRSISEGKDGHLFVGTAGGGLSRLDSGRFSSYTSADGLPTDIVSALYTDREGSLWVGTDGGGLNRLRRSAVLTYTRTQGLSHNRVTSVMQSGDGSMWLGTEGGGLNRLHNGSFTAFTTRQGLSSNLVRALLEDSRGNLWAGTDGAGLNIIRKGKVRNVTRSTILATAVILALAEDRSGTIWIGTPQGLFLYRGGAFEPFRNNVGRQVIMSLHESVNGDLWIGTIEAGLKRLRNGQVTSFGKANGLPGGFVTAIEESADGTLWLATNGGGLCRYRGGQFFTFSSKQGLFEDALNEVVDDRHGNLWMSSFRGIFRVAKSELADVADGRVRSLRAVSFGKPDGMKNQECTGRNQPNGWRATDGTVWFPTGEGVAVLDPAGLTGTSPPPSVVIENVLADSKPLKSSDHSVLPLGTEHLEIQYAGLSFLAPEKIAFRYRLDGFDKNWVAAGGRRVAYFTRLAPGTYTFLVSAQYNSSGWSTPASVTITVQPLFYQTPVFQLAGCLLVFGAATAGYKWRVRQLRANELRFANLVKRRTSELEASQSKFSYLFADTPLPLFLFDIETLLFQEVNEAALALYGYSKQQFLGLKIAAIRPQEDISVFLERLGRSGKAFRQDRENQQHVLKDGRIIQVEVTSRRIEWLGRETMLVAVQDVTAREEAELQLMSAKEAAEASNLAKSQFLANMSHEIRTPMNGILGIADLLQDTALTPSQSEFVALLKGSAQSLLSVINDILDLSKIEARKLRLEMLPFNLREISTTAMKSIAFRSHEKNVELKIEVAAEVPANITGDAGRLRQILLNLLGNAMKFTDAGYVALHVHVQAFEADSVVLRFSVHDTGIGIPEEKQDLIFEAFAQADGSTTRKFGGTGLGLAISRNLVEMMGGRIWLESYPAQGSKFHFTARFGLTAEPRLQDRTADDSNGPVSEIAGARRLRILVAEDNKVNQLVVRRVIEKNGHDVTLATNGKEALGILDTGRFDVFVCDIQMPELDGLATTAEIRRKELITNDRLPIIALTAHAMAGDRERCLDAGMDGYVAKPVNSETLFAEIAAVLSVAPDLLCSV